MRRILIILTLAAGLIAGGTSPARATWTGSRARSVLVVYVVWNEAPPDRATADVHRAIGVTANDWFVRASHQRFGGWAATSTGYVVIAPPRRDAGWCGSTFVGDVRDNAKAAGVNSDGYDVVAYYIPGRTCEWRGTHDGNAVYFNGADFEPNLVNHLLLRVLGLGYANTMACKTVKGEPVTLGAKCRTRHYNDPFSIMGSGSGTIAAVQQATLGWLSYVYAQAGTVRHKVAPIDAVSSALIQAVALPADGVTYWFEYRGGRVLMYRQGSASDSTSVLLDFHPETASFNDAGLAAGESYRFAGGNRVKVVSAVDNRAVIELYAHQ